MDLALVDGILPVNLKESLNGRCHLIDIVYVEGNDSESQNVGQVSQTAVFVTFQLQLTGKRIIRLDT